MDDAGVAVDQNGIAVQRLGRDAAGVNHQRNRQSARDDGGVAADRTLFEHDAFQFAAIFQEFRGADVAGDQNRVFGHLGPGILALSGQDAQQAVGEVVQIVQPFAQIGVGHLFQPRPRRALFLFHRGLGRQAALDVLFHPAQPAARMGEHAVGFEHRLLVLVEAFRLQQVIDRHAQHADGGADAVDLGQGIVGDGVRHDNAGFMQPDTAFGGTLLPGRAAKDHGLPVQGTHAIAVPGKGTEFGHLGQHHGHDFDGVGLFVRIGAGGFGLHDQHAELFANPLDRHAKEGGKDFLAGLRHEAEALFGRGIGGVDRKTGAGDPAHQTLTQLHPGFVDSTLFQTLGGAQFQRFGVTKEVDRANLGSHAVGDEMGDAVQPVLPLGGNGQHIAQAAKKFSTVAFAAFRHPSPPD